MPQLPLLINRKNPIYSQWEYTRTFLTSTAANAILQHKIEDEACITRRSYTP